MNLTATLIRKIPAHNRECFELQLDGVMVCIVSVWYSTDIDETDVTLAAKRLDKSPRDQEVRDAIKAAIIKAAA